jgi:hypothetical protein
MKGTMETESHSSVCIKDEVAIENTFLTNSYRVDLRTLSPQQKDRFVKCSNIRDWSMVTWKDVGKPYEVTTYSKDRLAWEKEHHQTMDPKTSWQFFNQAFHEWFVKDVPKEMDDKKKAFFRSLKSFRLQEIQTALQDVIQIHLWNYVHRVEDGIWDPRGKRALFEGLDVTKPKILFLGAAEGYEGMQLAAMYPGAEVVLVDYDAYCRDTRFQDFPESYPFLGGDLATGGKKVYYKKDFHIEYIVEDIRNLPFGKEFDIVLSVGLLEHFPDEKKPEVIQWHRKFLKPTGYCIMTTPRNQWKSRMYYRVMADVMNHTYRELMTVEQMGLYAYENGLNIERHGYIKVHNGLIATVR